MDSTTRIAAVLMLIFAGWLSPAGATAEFGRYHALVIGIDNYQHLTNLETSVNDASAVHDVLRRQYNFDSTLLLNPDRYRLVSALTELRAELEDDVNLVIYYAGHGYLDKETGEGFWLPVDAEEDSDANWVAVSTLTRILKAAAPKHVLVIADSCYSGTLTRAAPVGLRTGTERLQELRRLSAKRARKALTSGGLEPVNDGGGDGHSVFTRALLDTLRANREILDGSRLYATLRPKVIKNAEQTPAYSDIRHAGDEDGDFIFVPRAAARSTASAPAASGRPGDQAFELEFWRSIEDGDDPADLEDFLAQYPDSRFAGLARRRLDKLQIDQDQAKSGSDAAATALKPESDGVAAESATPKPGNSVVAAVKPRAPTRPTAGTPQTDADRTISAPRSAPAKEMQGNTVTAAIARASRMATEIEPNDKPAEATALAIGDSVSASILPRGDGDLYAMTFERQGALTVRFTDVPEAINIAYRLRDETGRQVWPWQTATVAGEPFEAWADIRAPGRYLIEVRDGRNDASAPAHYKMTAAFAVTADPAEPNDKAEQATPLAWDSPVRANILPRADGDLYAVTLAHQGELIVDFDTVPPEIDIAFRVLNQAGAQVWRWQKAKAPGEPFASWVDLKTPGTYLIEVRDGRNDARSAEPYRMTARLTATADQAEPNDAPEVATPIVLSQAIQANILPRGDGDLYRVDLPRHGRLTVQFTKSPQELNMAFRVLDVSGRQVAGWKTAPKAGEPYHAWADLKAAGIYLIEVRDGRNDARSTAPYEMRATFQ